MSNARLLIANMTPRGRVALLATAAAVALVAVLLLRLASAPSYSQVLSGIDPAETGKITSALDERGIKYELRNNGTAVAVDKSKTAEARIALAEKGLPGKGEVGYEIFDESKLGASDMQQRVNYQRALEGEIARTIEQVQGVAGAQVRLVLPEDQLFVDEQTPATAAVLLSGDPANLDSSAVRGIAQLVASSVKGLKTNNVSITDQNGQLVWPTESSGTGGGVGTNAKAAAENRFERTLESNLDALLMQTVGPNKAQVKVQADLNVDESTQDKLEYAKKGIPLKQTTESEKLKGSGSTAGGRSGTSGNLAPSYGSTSGGNNNYNRTQEQTDFGVDKTVTRTKIAPGQINRLSVALVVDKSVAAADVKALEKAVAQAAGIDPERGDPPIATSTIKFATPTAATKASPIPTGALGIAKYVGLALASLVFLFFVTRGLRRRESEVIAGEPVWLREIDSPASLSQLERGAGDILPQLAARNGAPTRKHAEQIAEREPERVAQQLRRWMEED